MVRRVEIVVSSLLRERLAQGHPWVYRNHVPSHVRLPSGAWVIVRCGAWRGYALWDAEGPIALRIFSTRTVPDIAWLRERLTAAWNLRAPLRAAGITAYRWVFGEGDGVPGIVVDRYNDIAVLQASSAGTLTLIEDVATAILKVDPTVRRVALRMATESRSAIDEGDEGDGDARLRSLYGESPPREIVVVEHGIRFAVALHTAQKTGLFLDQRENRRFVEGLAAGRTVLNCFAYTGGFSLYALRGGARQVVSVDVGKGLASATARNLALNRLDDGRHRFETADCFELLEQYAAAGQRFDLVILDPPSFARRKESRYAAQRAYVRLNALGMRCVKPGGLLATASCTTQVGPEAFREALASAGALAERRLRIIHEAGQPLDHPVPAHFPEGRYLKFVVGRVEEAV
ncbi:class I SAM-dependent rRNA methyltransferase [Roseiflexus sp.]|uniref:class I SAM-dependent rRNA methyltransferase n=1 Tax=Roseiflexus sp. TaxID=2562120 RepID=UPI0021DC5FA6|nr:class I SAM-dependent rRNA methyltransferase [Roseiflexus sp.]GIW02992.1 MAG: SAM-dependent methyltransferase [Roseiflexus sp.]